MGEGTEKTGISRRDLLKRSAVAGGLVWAAPTILASPASASHSTCNCPAGALYALKFNNQNNSTSVNACEGPGDNVSTGNCSASAGFTDTRNGCCLIANSLVSFSTVTNNSTHRYTLQPGVRLCNGFAKCGSDCLTGPPYVTSVAGPNGTTVVTITCENLSHSEIVVCVSGTVLPNGC